MKKQKKVNKKPRYYGIVKVRRFQKMCWVSKESKNGWSLGLALGDRDVWLTGLRFAKTSDVDEVTKHLSTVFVHMKKGNGDDR